MTAPHRYRVYGIELTCDEPVPWLDDRRTPVAAGHRPAALRFRTVFGDLPEHITEGLGRGGAIEGADATDSPITFHPGEPGTVVRFHGVADHLVERRSVTCYLPDPTLLPLVQVQLLGIVLALWLEQHGVVTLHAAVVEVDGGAIALLGAPGGGKTTLAAALVADGARFVVDDLAALESSGPQLAVQPGYPLLRLWPDQAELLAGGTAGLTTVHPWYDKHVVPLDRLGHGSAATAPVPLAQVVVPSRSPGERPIAFEQLDTGAGLQALVANAFLPEPVHGLGLAAGRLPTLLRLLREVPVARLHYPTGFDRLPQVTAAIRDLMASG